MSDEQTMLDEVKARVPLEEYFHNYLRVPITARGGGQWRANCPYHNDENPSLLIYSEERVFNCFSCKRSGSIVDAVMEEEGFDSEREAVRWLYDNYDPESHLFTTRDKHIEVDAKRLTF